MSMPTFFVNLYLLSPTHIILQLAICILYILGIDPSRPTGPLGYTLYNIALYISLDKTGKDSGRGDGD